MENEDFGYKIYQFLDKTDCEHISQWMDQDGCKYVMSLHIRKDPNKWAQI